MKFCQTKAQSILIENIKLGSQVIKIGCTFKDVQGTPMLMYSVHYVCNIVWIISCIATLSSVTGVGSPVK